MEDLYLEEMPAPCRDFVLAVPGRRREVVHCLVESLPAPPVTHVKRRVRSVACGFPERRLRVTERVAQVRRGG